jgi:signal peptide peptidase SppA
MSGALDWIHSHCWAIIPEKLDTIIGIADRSFSDIQSITAKRDKYLENAARTRQRDGVAILDVFGPLFARANLFMEISGATSYEMLAKEFQLAMDDPKIHAIVLQIDSPGGEVNGNTEFSQMVFDARKKKKVYAFVQGLGASAAYWIASSADKVIASETALLGSIGTIMAWKQESDKPGVKSYEFVSSASPKKVLNPDTEGGKGQIQKMVDDLGQVFVNAVARNRGVSADVVLKTFGQGGLLIASEAVSAKMADAVGTMEGTISQLISMKQNRTGGIIMSGENATQTFTAEQLDKAKAEAFAQGKEAGIKAGIDQENARIKSIEAIKVPGSEAVVAEHKFNPSMTKEMVAVKVLDAQEAARAKIQAGLQKDGEGLAVQAEGVGSPSAPVAPAADGKRKLDVKVAAAAADAKQGYKETSK